MKQIIFSAVGFLMLVATSVMLFYGYGATVVSVDGSQARTVYLTFDDGPSATTERVLDVLREFDVQATFFIIGATTEQGLALYNRIVEEGHSLGLHSYSHDTNKIYRSLDAFTEDFEKLETWVYEKTGERPLICRMVGGSNTRLCPAIVKEQILTYLVERGYACYDWDIDPKDSGAYALPANQLARNVIAGAEKKRDSDIVILLHDDALRTSLPDALRQIIPYFKQQGYTFDMLRDDTESVRRILPEKYKG